MLAKRFEGFHRVPKSHPGRPAHPYLCPAGFWTIGYGHLCDPKHPPITVAEAEGYLAADLMTALKATLRCCPVLATEPEGRLAAIVDFTFNLGAGRLQMSTLRRRINQRDWAGAAQELQRWVYGGGRVLPGLVASEKLRRGCSREIRGKVGCHPVRKAGVGLVAELGRSGWGGRESPRPSTQRWRGFGSGRLGPRPDPVWASHRAGARGQIRAAGPGERWAGAISQQALASGAVRGLDAHRRVDRETAAVFPCRHRLASSAGSRPRRANPRNSRRRTDCCTSRRRWHRGRWRHGRPPRPAAPSSNTRR